jgi:hypothetical protein
MTLFQIKVIKAKKMNIPQVKRELEREAKNQAKIVEKKYKETTSTWQGEKPKFESIIDVGGSEIAILTGPTGSNEAVNKFVWLDEGTSIRWALMSSNWRSKTKPGKLRSGRGKGSVVIAGRRAMQRRNIRPRPGIKARNWTLTLQRQRRKPFTRAMIAATNRGLENLYN